MDWRSELCALIESRIGIRVAREGVPADLERFALDRTAALGLRDARAYVEMVAREGMRGVELGRISARVANNQTYFFRDAELFEPLLRELWVRAPGRPLAIWSAGCSSGDEAYTLAMLGVELGIPLQLLATDVDPEALAEGRTGEYGAWALRSVDAERKRRQFEALPEARFRVRDEVKKRVEFRHHNLLHDPLPRPPGRGAWDLILCRNVFIYHRPAMVERVVQGFASVLEAAGWLLLGASETLHGLCVPFVPERRGAHFGYRRRSLALPSIPAPASLPPAGPCSAPPPVGAKTPLASRPDDQFDALARRMSTLSIEQARDALLALLDREPHCVPARLTLGHTYLREHRFDEALAAYLQLLETEPLLVEAHFFEGLVHLKRGQHERAREALRRAMFLEPEHWPSSWLLVGVCERLSLTLEAQRNLAWTRQLVEKRLPSPFRSCLHGLSIAELSAERTLELCEIRGRQGHRSGAEGA